MAQSTLADAAENSDIAGRSAQPAAGAKSPQAEQKRSRPPAPEVAPDGAADDLAGESEASDQLAGRFQLRRWLRQSSGLFISAVVHMVAFLVLGWLVVEPPPVSQLHEMVAEVLEEPDLNEELKIELENQLTEVTERTTQVFSSSPVVGEAVGAAGPAGLVSAPTMDKALLEQVTNSDVQIEGVFIDVPTSSKLIVEAPDGQVGDARAVVDNYEEALDRITQELLWMLDKGPVLVVWAFDQSESMKDDQQEIKTRIEHVYRQLGIVSRENEDALETAVVSFGGRDVKKGIDTFTVHTERPTHDRGQIMAAIDAVPVDPSGGEYTCSAVMRAIAIHRQYATRSRRQMALILVTDESGDRLDNDANLERAIAEAKAARCRTYVLGREAVFGYPYVHMRWVHPQTKHVHWLAIDRGPETAFVEQLQTNGFHRRYDAHPSGFGPFETTRLGRETGGIFFMLPSLETDLVHGTKRNYDMEAPYYPDLRAKLEVKAEIERSPLRTMLEKVIYDLNPYNEEAAKIIVMRVEFATDNEQLVRQIRHEQAKAIIYLQYLAKAEATVAKLADLRKQEPSPRWQANYDMLYAQLVAYQARMYEYGAYLEEFTNDLQAYLRNPTDKNNRFKPPPATKSPKLHFVHWDIRTRQKVITGEKVQPYIDRASVMFKDIIANHPGTPWAARAEHELKRGFGVELVPDYDIEHPNPTGPLIPIPKL